MYRAGIFVSNGRLIKGIRVTTRSNKISNVLINNQVSEYNNSLSQNLKEASGNAMLYPDGKPLFVDKRALKECKEAFLSPTEKARAGQAKTSSHVTIQKKRPTYGPFISGFQALSSHWYYHAPWQSGK